jgi:two-component system, NarL family, nitrate/nitrite response regulator NarL
LTVQQPLKISVLIIADIRLHCEGLAETLRRWTRIEVVGVAIEPVQGLQRVLDLQPDVVLVDTHMPQAIALIVAILAATSAAKVIALAVSEEDPDVLAFAEAGVSGYVAHDAAVDNLVGAIERAARGEVPCPPRLAAILLRHICVLAAQRPATTQRRSLTPRELEVVGLIDLGLSNKQIARQLCIEVPTVKNHVHRILDKLQLDRRADVAAWVRTNEGRGLVRLRASTAGIY